MGLMSLVRRMLGGRPEGGAAAEAPTPEALRAAFQSRYHHFKLLLAANNQALEAMASLEEAMRGEGLFGMHFVRERTTRILTSVFSMVRNLRALAPGRYDGLDERFKALQQEIGRLLDPPRAGMGAEFARAPLILDLAALDRSHAYLVGPKMASLGEAHKALDLPIPDGFVVTAAAFGRFLAAGGLQEEIDRRIQAAEVRGLDALFKLSSELQQLVIQSPLPDEVEEELRRGFQALRLRAGGDVHVAMRSSAYGEDLPGASFAGQYRSVLFVGPDDLATAYKEVVASKYGLSAMSYRLTKGLRDRDVAMCVGCMCMVDAASGGVAYSASPLDPSDDRVAVSSVWGLPRSVVDGSVPVDLFLVSRDSRAVVERNVPEKKTRYRCYLTEDGAGVCREELSGEEAAQPSISDAKILEIADMALALERHFGAPQDLEWATDASGTVVLLQCRMLHSVPAAEPESARQAEEAVELPRPAPLLGAGITASPGVAAGPVQVLRSDMDALRFERGSVLVVEQALPRWAALLSRAAAVVAERGSALGHLASVAREFGVPAVFGAEGACDVLARAGADAAEVTVDAGRGEVYAGRLEHLVRAGAPRRHPLEGTPVWNDLAAVSERIIPLTLLDPDAPEFKPAKVRSLHDITRFCHEKSVREMFTFGRDTPYPERSAKQIVAEVPMQFWVIDLDDGFTREVQGRFVRLEDIVSVPFRALWEGMMAVPWAGPPPVSARGFMSILVEASANPNLEAASHSEMAARNYFMVSRNFLSLQSRFGFHFCTVEALVGERDMENYAGFRFKGGAASMDRRVQRVRLIASILEGHGFRTEVVGDTANARVEGYPMEIMQERLKVLGYLLTHTRQIDMVMHDPVAVEHHRRKMLADLGRMVDQPAP